jgi:hypothetical protein
LKNSRETREKYAQKRRRNMLRGSNTAMPLFFNTVAAEEGAAEIAFLIFMSVKTDCFFKAG